MEDGERENELLSPNRADLHQTTESLPVLSRSDRPLEMKEERVVTDLNDRKPDAGVGMELMAPPSHPVHLFEKQPSDVDTIAASTSCSWPHAAAYANFAPAEESCAKPGSPVATLLLASTSHYHSSFSLNFYSSQAAAAETKPKPPHQGTAELLMAITSAIKEQAPRLITASDEDNEEESEEAPDQDQVDCHTEHDELKAAIRIHPLYPEMVLTHLDILKIGAPNEVHDKLDDFSKKFQRSHGGRRLTSKLDPDSELDNFMKSYVVMLSNFREDLEEPVNKFMQFADKMTKDLEDLCGHYVETKPEEDDHGFGIDMESRAEGAQNSDESSPEMNIPPTSKHYPTDIDESIIVDPEALEEDLKKMLMKKFGRHLSGLTAEFNRVRKKGKLPDAARRILKDWFNDHCHWPYPSEMEKEYLQHLCELSLKQINNWFINERKRHWNGEGRSMYPSLKPNEDDGADEGSGHVEL